MREINQLKQKYQNVVTSVFENKSLGSVAVAKRIANLIRKKATQEKPFVLGLATGSTPLGVYAELVRMHKEEGLSFENVVTFNLDEYLPMAPADKNSYVRFMHENLFDHIDIKSENVHIPDGSLGEDEVVDFCREYEAKIASFGGLDLQILGIGRTGHIGFNEPGSGLYSLTRRVKLDPITIKDAAKDFGGEAGVPKEAVTMGVSTILNAKRVVLMAWGENKAAIVKRSIEDEVTDLIPATYLQYHSNVQYVLDNEAATDLATTEIPWLFGDIEWTDRMIRKAVTWLALQVKKPVLKLTDEDYIKYGMRDLLEACSNSYNINIKVFNDLQHTITGWPGGKPNADDSHRPAPSEPARKRVVVFSPHPDDDVISMGGTFIRLASQGHDVNVAYHVSGNIAVSDEDVLRYAKFIKMFNGAFGGGESIAEDKLAKIVEIIKNRKPEDLDSPEALEIKGLIRRLEALNADEFVGVPENKVTFLDMPFYKTGTVKKKPLSQADIDVIVNYLQEVKPHQIYAAADLADPHGTHGVCFDALIGALKQLEGEAWLEDCVLWGYRGAWAEWNIADVDMAVPLSPCEMDGKIKAIYCHGSQKDNVLFPGEDKREFWERARDRNNATAKLYDQLGLAEYEAMEVFAKYDFRK
ncbi:glucosamine-6-phosphate deaminase [Halosquirtibacter xylanolyticus]|uniref:glucosamine-6-phosphate deaminase n=1 Tax=Halosquirtibacter xylanolyticus TaxID=3374599 RepID=UPI00374883D3|nr:glucosamine-6-phosphate deaminase [Prolixibacteraceae bacterium]